MGINFRTHGLLQFEKLLLESLSHYIETGLKISQKAVSKYLKATQKCNDLAIDSSSKFCFNGVN